MQWIGLMLAWVHMQVLVSPLGAQGIPPEEAERFWDMIRGLSEIIPAEPGMVPAASPSARVRLEPAKVTVSHWEESVRLSLEVTGVRNLGAFFADFEVGPGLSVPPSDFVSAGPLWTQFGSQPADTEIPSPIIGSGTDGSASIFGFSPWRSITGDGTLAVVEFPIRQPGSVTVKLTSFLWMEGGGGRVMRKAEVLGNAQVEVAYRTPAAYLSFVPPGSERAASEGPFGVQRQVVAGTTFPVYVCVEALAGVNGVSFSVDFDNGGLELIGVREGELVRSTGRSLCCFDSAQRGNAAGRLLDQGIALLERGAGIRGGGCLAEILFLARGSPSATIQLRNVTAVQGGEGVGRQEIEVRGRDIPLTVTRLR